MGGEGQAGSALRNSGIHLPKIRLSYQAPTRDAPAILPAKSLLFRDSDVIRIAKAFWFHKYLPSLGSGVYLHRMPSGPLFDL